MHFPLDEALLAVAHRCLDSTDDDVHLPVGLLECAVGVAPWTWWREISLVAVIPIVIATASVVIAVVAISAPVRSAIRVWASVATSAAARAASPQRSARSAYSATLTFRSAVAPAMACGRRARQSEISEGERLESEWSGGSRDY